MPRYGGAVPAAAVRRWSGGGVDLPGRAGATGRRPTAGPRRYPRSGVPSGVAARRVKPAWPAAQSATWERSTWLTRLVLASDTGVCGGAV